MDAETRERLIEFVLEGYTGAHMYDDVKEALREIDRLTPERADLLAACEAILDDTTSMMAGVALCRAAVAKARGEGK